MGLLVFVALNFLLFVMSFHPLSLTKAFLRPSIRPLGCQRPALLRRTGFLTSRLSSSTTTATSSEKTKDSFFVTTPIYYVNGEPHLGHAYTSVMADILARYHRKLGQSVFFLTGTDEHGQKVEASAIKAKKTPLQFADETSQRFRELTETLGCSPDKFIRTTEEAHQRGVEHLWERLVEKGLIYKGFYEGWYSVRDEAFFSENELTKDGLAPTGAPAVWMKEECYFFKLSSFTQPLLDYYEKNPEFISPASRRNEVISFLKQEGGLRDLSISRSTFSWGIPVPKDSKHVIYVWMDALMNYLTALGYPNLEDAKVKEFWPADVHLVGKDILRFHVVYWPAFLMGAGLPLPKVRPLSFLSPLSFLNSSYLSSSPLFYPLPLLYFLHLFLFLLIS